MDTEGTPGRPRPSGILRRISRSIRDEAAPAALRIVPFAPGRRPADEARSPRLGASDQAAFILRGRAETNRAYVLYSLPAAREGMTVDATLSLGGRTVPGWDRRTIDLWCFDERGDGSRRPAGPTDTGLVLALVPETDFWPGASWDPYGFGHL